MTQMNPYLRNQIMTARPGDLVTYTFDAAILSCRRHDRIRALESVSLLVKGLRTDYHPEIGMMLFRSYQQILDKINLKDWKTAEKWLLNMRDLWKEII